MSKSIGNESLQGVAVGDVVAGKYRVERVLGQGGMGVVVAARHEELGQKVAIKVLRPEISSVDGALERFLREARAAAQLESDHIARVFDVGQLGGSSAFMVMEHLGGTDLEKLLVARGRLEVSEAVDHVLEALEALAHAHARGMVHRDLKPSNLFLEEKASGTRRIKVLDFGISKTESGLSAASTQASTLTSPQAMLGSPAYMAPEQIRSSKSVDARADIWSIGVILYELLTATSPFAGETVGETFARVIDASPEPIRKKRPELSADLAAIVATCLAPAREERFANVAELAAALAPFASERHRELAARIARVLGVSVTGADRRSIVSIQRGGHVNAAAETVVAANTDAGAKGSETMSTWAGSEMGLSRSKGAWIAMAAGIAVIAGLGAFFILREVRRAPAAPEERAAATRAEAPANPIMTPKPEVLPVETAAAAPSVAALAPTAAPSASSAIVLPKKPGALSTAPVVKSTATPVVKAPYPKNLLDGRD